MRRHYVLTVERLWLIHSIKKVGNLFRWWKVVGWFGLIFCCKNWTKFTSIVLSLTIYNKRYYTILLQVQKYYTLYSNLNPNQVLNAPLNSRSVRTESNVSHHLENAINLNILTVTINPMILAAIAKITKWNVLTEMGVPSFWKSVTVLHNVLMGPMRAPTFAMVRNKYST